MRSTMEKISFYILILAMATCLAFPALSCAMGLEVNPSEFTLVNVPIGRVVVVSELSDQKVRLNIWNKSNVAYTYTVGILPSKETTADLPKEYKDIPDTNWIWPENTEVMVPAHSYKDVELYLNIPIDKKYKNKKYQAVIEVKSKKNNPKEIFVLACQLKILFSTSSQGKRGTVQLAVPAKLNTKGCGDACSGKK